MKLPNADTAVVDIAKLRDYCLNPNHPVGKHKARVFNSALGLAAGDAEYLCDAILEAALILDVALGVQDEYGWWFTLDLMLVTDAGQATVRTGWIIRTEEDCPRLTTAYVL